MKRIIILPLLLASAAALADTPLQSLVYYSSEARRQQPDFVADGARGRSFALRNWGVSQSLARCATCHTERPAGAGRHAITGKPIAALSPAVSPGRFGNPAKVEKWFRRNCTEVVGRGCTAAEKADFIKFVMEDQTS
jgi:mono/diheme cytochrome c family protein